MDVFSVKKVFLGGTAVAATVLLAMSAAWACSPYGDRAVRLQGGDVVDAGPPGSRIVVEGTWYQDEYGPVTIELTPGSDWGLELARPALVYTHTAPRPHPVTGLMVDTRFHRFTADVTIPADAKGAVFVIQRSSAYGIKKSGAVFTVQASQNGTPSSIAPTASTTPATLATAPTSVETTPITRAIAPGSQTGPAIGAATPDVQRSAGSDVRGLPLADGAAAAIASDEPVARAEAKLADGAQLPPLVDPQRDVQTLWSGLEKSDGPSATLTGPATAPAQPSWVGATLLTMGGLVLVTGAAVAVPRRRALRRIR